jgi:hypothetical protein
MCTANNILYIVYNQTKAIKKVHIQKFEFLKNNLTLNKQATLINCKGLIRITHSKF